MSIEKLSSIARKTLEDNKECFMAQWILQNPDELVSEYVLCQQNDWSAGVHKYWMEKK